MYVDIFDTSLLCLSTTNKNDDDELMSWLLLVVVSRSNGCSLTEFIYMWFELYGLVALYMVTWFNDTRFSNIWSIIPLILLNYTCLIGYLYIRDVELK